MVQLAGSQLERIRFGDPVVFVLVKGAGAAALRGPSLRDFLARKTGFGSGAI